MRNLCTNHQQELTILGFRFEVSPSSRHPPHSTTSKIGLMCLLPLLDFFELVLLRRRRSFFVFSCAINSLISDPLSATISHILDGDAGDRLEFGVAGGVQSRSVLSKTRGKSSSSEMIKELDRESSSSWLEFEESEARRGHEGNAQEGDCGLELDEEGISIGNVE